MGINHTPGPWIVYGAPGNVWAPFDQENVANAYIADRDRETQSANARLIAEAPAMLAALRKISQGADCFTFNSDADVFRFVDMVTEAVAPILSRIDGAPTAQPAGVWRIVSGEPDTPRALYWSNCDGWGGIAGSDAFSQAERETLNLPIGGRWWFDSDDEPAAPISEAGDHCASCGAEEGESHGAQCETRGFAVGVDARRLDTGALRTVAGDDAAWLEATASRDGGEC